MKPCINIMNSRFGIFVLASVLAFTTLAENEARATFGKWHVGIGGALNARARSNVGMRRLLVPPAYRIASSSTKAAALKNAQNRRYDGGGFIDRDSLDNGFDTENWKLPAGSYEGSGHFVLDNAYQEVVDSSVGQSIREGSDDCRQFGVSIEVSRELWQHDENDAHRWGLDFVAAFSYFFARDIYRVRQSVTRTDTVRDGVIRTDVNDPDTMYDYDHGWDSPVNGMYGYGNATRTYFSPALGFSGIGEPYDVGGPVQQVSSSLGYAADGDYQELEMLFMLRPWYEITDWWRVFAEVGVGVSWGCFDTTVYGAGAPYDESFSQWDCYGVAGLGTALRYKRYTLSLDILGRFLRDDLDVNGRYLDGSIERSIWGLRLMGGYEF